MRRGDKDTDIHGSRCRGAGGTSDATTCPDVEKRCDCWVAVLRLGIVNSHSSVFDAVDDLAAVVDAERWSHGLWHGGCRFQTCTTHACLHIPMSKYGNVQSA
jgi:hypothetical protein